MNNNNFCSETYEKECITSGRDDIEGPFIIHKENNNREIKNKAQRKWRLKLSMKKKKHSIDG
jgi:hypothetical protein